MEGSDNPNHEIVNWVRYVLRKTGATTQSICVRFEGGSFINIDDNVFMVYSYVIHRAPHVYQTDLVFRTRAQAACLRDETEWILVNGVPTTVQCSSFHGRGTGGD
jgi:hypothetical protein